MTGLNGGSVDVFLSMMSMVLVPWGVGAILGNGYEIQGQDNKDIQYFKLISVDVH